VLTTNEGNQKERDGKGKRKEEKKCLESKKFSVVS
jgi:hypothetical protein